MKTIPLERVTEVLNRIFNDDMNVRIEWDTDIGYVWALLGPNGPPEEMNPSRIWADHAIEGPITVISPDPDAGEMYVRAGRLMKDWHARGQKETLTEAVTALAEAAAKHKPKGAFAKWWKNGAPATKVTTPGGMHMIEVMFAESYAIQLIQALADKKRVRGKYAGTWYNIISKDLMKAPLVSATARYLLERDLVERHPEDKDLFKLKKPKPPFA